MQFCSYAVMQFGYPVRDNLSVEKMSSAVLQFGYPVRDNLSVEKQVSDTFLFYQQ